MQLYLEVFPYFELTGSKQPNVQFRGINQTQYEELIRSHGETEKTRPSHASWSEKKKDSTAVNRAA